LKKIQAIEVIESEIGGTW